eukprot:jgi/Chrzof1/12563/UNPLg00516.t1
MSRIICCISTWKLHTSISSLLIADNSNKDNSGGRGPPQHHDTDTFESNTQYQTDLIIFTQFILGCWVYTTPCAVGQVVSLAWTTFTGRVVAYDWACQVVS